MNPTRYSGLISWLLPIFVVMTALGGPKRFSGHGLVLSVDRSGKTITISHDRIPGYMAAMIMSFHVQDSALLKGVEQGRQIYFRLNVDRNETFLDHILVTSADSVDPALWQSPVISKRVNVGELVPDFQLMDHNRQPVSASRFAGKIVAVTFVYTRCPLPDYCPRMMDNFVDLKKRFKERLGKDLVLLTITIDPQYDTPEVLRRYAETYGAGETQGVYYLTGNKEEIDRVSGFFGLGHWPDKGAIMHNLQTGLIDRNGRLAANVEGKEYTAKQLGDLVEKFLLQ